MDLIDRLEAEGRITCIRPLRPMEVGRIENDVMKLERLYEEGFALGELVCTRKFYSVSQAFSFIFYSHLSLFHDAPSVFPYYD